MRVIYGRTAIIAGFVSGADYSDRRRSEFLPSVPYRCFRRLYGAWTRLVLLILNKETTPETKLMWTVITMLLPLVGAALYVYVETQPGYRLLANA